MSLYRGIYNFVYRLAFMDKEYSCSGCERSDCSFDELDEEGYCEECRSIMEEGEEEL